MPNLSVPRPTPANQRLAGPSRWSRTVVAWLAALAIVAGFLAPAHADEPIAAIERYLGARGGWGFGQILDWDIDGADNLYVLEGVFGRDPGGNGSIYDFVEVRVVKFSSSGQFVRQFGSFGDGAGEFKAGEYPNDNNQYNLRMDSDGNVNVFIFNSPGNHQWTKFSPDGVLIRQRQLSDYGAGWNWPYPVFGKESIIAVENGGFDICSYSGNDQFISGPTFYMLPKDGTVLHLDREFNLSLALDGTSFTTLDWAYDRSSSIARGADGSRYMIQASAVSPRVFVFDRNWALIRQFGSAGSGDAEFNNPSSIHVLPNGNLWIHDKGNNRWQQLTPQGSYVSENRTGIPPGFNTVFPGPANGSKWRIRSDGNLILLEGAGPRQGWNWPANLFYIPDYSYRSFPITNEPAISVFNPAGNTLSRVGGNAFRSPSTGIAVDGSATEFTGGTGWGAPRFDVTSDGQIVTLSGSFRPDEYGLTSPSWNAVLRFYSATGVLLWERVVPNSGDWVSNPNDGFWSSAERNVLVSGSSIYAFATGVQANSQSTLLDTNKTFVYDFQGNLLSTGLIFPRNSSENLATIGVNDWAVNLPVRGFPTALRGDSFVSPDGRAYQPVVDTLGVITAWSQTRSPVPGGWSAAIGQIAVDSTGRTYRVNPVSHIVERSDWDGTVLPALGAQGTGPGQFDNPTGVAVGPDDTIYVSDTFNNRIQRFSRSRSYLGAFPVPYPGQIEVRGNKIYVLEAASRIGVYSLDLVEKIAPSSVFTQSPAKTAAGWNNTAVTGTVLATDNTNGVGVREIHYTVDMGPEQVVAGDTASMVISTAGVHTVAYWAVDNNGNTETTKYATVKIDLSKPTTSASLSPVANVAGWNRTKAVVTATGADDASGIASVALKVNGGPETSTAAASASTTLSTEGTHTVQHRAVDGAGNSGDWASTTVRIDKTAPTVSATIVGQTLTLTAADALSGVSSIRYSIDGGAPVLYSAPVTLALTAKSVSFWAVDNAGNTSVVDSKLIGNFLKSISITPNPTAYAGSTVTVRVDLVSTPPSGGLLVNLDSSNPAVLPVPSSVVVPAGASFTTFTAKLGGVPTDTDVRVTASVEDTFATANLGVLVPVPESLTVAPSLVTGGNSTTGTVNLVSAAPVGGQVVALASFDPSVVTVPATVTVPAGAMSASFPITTDLVSADKAVLISAEADDTAAVAVVLVRRIQVNGLALSPTIVAGGTSLTGAISITRPAPAGGVTIALVSSNPSVAAVPATVTIPAGVVSAVFAISTEPVRTSESPVIQARFGGSVARAVLKVNPSKMATFTLSPSSAKGGTSVKGTITLTGVAPSGGLTIKLKTLSNRLTIPASVLVPAGQSKVEFTVTTAVVPANTATSVTAFENLDTKTANLTLTK